MKKIVQQPGGRKYFGDDFMLMQLNSLLLEKMLAAYGNFVVYGCTKNGTSISAGVVMLGGEFATFDGATGVSTAYYVQPQVSTLQGPYRDDVREAYQVRKAVACTSNAEGAFRLDNAARFENVVKLTKSQITDFPTSLPASDVYAWAKAATKPSYTASEVGAAASSHTHKKGQITDFPPIPDAQVPSDWNQADSSKPDFIKNKPNSDLSTPWQASVGSSGTAYFRKDKVGMVELIIEIHGDTGDNIGYVPAGFAPNNPAMYDDYYITVVDTYSNAIASVRFWTNGMLERYYTDGGFGYGVIRQCYYPLT